MKLVIEIELNNAAFGVYGAEEVNRILTSIGERVPDPLRETAAELILHDANGNWCGYARIVRGNIKTRVMRRVVDTWEVARLWAAQAQDEARNKRGSFYFTGLTIYSYGSHFPIATIVTRKKQRAVLFTTSSYSTTTAKHKREARGAALRGGMPVFTVPDINGSHLLNRRHYLSQIKDLSLKAARQTKYSWHYQDLIHTVKEANDYAAFFGLKTRFAATSDEEAARIIHAQRSVAALQGVETRRQNELDRKCKPIEDHVASICQAEDNLLAIARELRNCGHRGRGVKTNPNRR